MGGEGEDVDLYGAERGEKGAVGDGEVGAGGPGEVADVFAVEAEGLGAVRALMSSPVGTPLAPTM